MIGIFSSRPSGSQLAYFAVSSALAALKKMPVLVLGSCVAFWLLAAGTQYAGQKLGIPQDSFLDGIQSSRPGWFHALRAMIAVIIALPLTMAICRFVLSGETGPRLFSRSGMAFMAWAIAAAAITVAMLYLMAWLSAPTLRLVRVFLWQGVIALPLYVLLVFPAIAAEKPAASVADRLETTLRHWDENVMLFLTALLLAAVPLAAIWFGAKWLVTRLAGPGIWDSAAGWPVNSTAIFIPLVLVLAASLVSGFYAATGPTVAADTNSDKTGRSNTVHS